MPVISVRNIKAETRSVPRLLLFTPQRQVGNSASISLDLVWNRSTELHKKMISINFNMCCVYSTNDFYFVIKQGPIYLFFKETKKYAHFIVTKRTHAAEILSRKNESTFFPLLCVSCSSSFTRVKWNYLSAGILLTFFYIVFLNSDAFITRKMSCK